jgi:hypothetical protein
MKFIATEGGVCGLLLQYFRSNNHPLTESATWMRTIALLLVLSPLLASKYLYHHEKRMVGKT